MNRLNRKKFTLIELLVVLVIVAILASLLIPMVVRARTKAKMANDINNLKQVYIALVTYSQDNDDNMPYMGSIESGDQQSKTLWMLLPYIGYNSKVLAPSIDQMDGHLLYNALSSDPESLPFPEFAYSPIYQNYEDDTDTSLMSFDLDRSPFPIISTYSEKYDTLIILNSTGEVEFNKIQE